MRPSTKFLTELRKNSGLTVLKAKTGLQIKNCYFLQGLKGTRQEVYARKIIDKKLNEAIVSLEPDYGLILYDAFRSRETQLELFESFQKQFKSLHPEWSNERLFLETSKSVAHPNDTSRFEVSPHNSGAAIDVGLFQKAKLQIWEPNLMILPS
ncbi:MAG: hypothetical protein HY537_01755, partial [Deltaproteobacteria bacterium]|nr:hypothetical protein [Deltaproteobacteria bacterium]